MTDMTDIAISFSSEENLFVRDFWGWEQISSETGKKTVITLSIGFNLS